MILTENEPVGLVHNSSVGSSSQFQDKINEAKHELLSQRNEEENHPLVKEWRQRKATSILKWAYALDDMISHKLWPKQRDWICTEIRIELRKLGFNENEIHYVNEVLPKEFKRDSLARNQIGGDISTDFEDVLTQGQKDIDDFDSIEEFQEYLDKNFKARQIIKDREKNATNYLDLNNEYALEVARQKGFPVNPPREEKKTTISTIAPEPNKCESYYAALEVYNRLQGEPDPETGETIDYNRLWLNLAKKLEKYPATAPGKPITEEDKQIARFINGKLQTLESECRMLKSFTDDKYAQSMWHWFKTIIIEGHYGKHAAAVMSKIVPKCGDPKKATTKPRPLTRERVGDIKEKYLDWMYEFGESMEFAAWWIGVANVWDQQFHAPYNADRRNREGPNLSETSFGANEPR